MNDLIIINGQKLPVREYNGQRIVTFKDIDSVHKRPEGTARKRFNDNKKHFIEGEDYFVRNSDEAKTEFQITAPNGLMLITESGYYMIVKSFTDDLSWSVQRELVNCYFRVQQTEETMQDRNDMMKFRINTLMEIAKADFIDSLGKVHIFAKVSEMLTGKVLISPDNIITAYEKTQADRQNEVPLPITDCHKSISKFWYTATDIGKILGVSAQKIGRTANQNNMKTSEYGEYVKTTIHSGEVPVFRYYEKAIPKFRELFSSETADLSENACAKKHINFAKKDE